MVFFSIPTNLALFIQNNRLGDAHIAGLALGLANLFSFMAGAGFKKLYDRLQNYTTTVELALMCIAFAGLGVSHNISSVFASLTMFGLGFGI